MTENGAMKVRGVREGGEFLICGSKGTQSGGSMHRHQFRLQTVKLFFYKTDGNICITDLFIQCAPASHGHKRNVFSEGLGCYYNTGNNDV